MANININSPSVSKLDDLRDVDLTTTLPSLNDILTFDGTKFIPSEQTIQINDTDELPEGSINFYYSSARVAAEPLSTAAISALSLKANIVHNHDGTYELADSDIVKAPLGILPILDGSNLTGVGTDLTPGVDYLTPTTINTALDLKADLVGGKVPISQLPTSSTGTVIETSNTEPTTLDLGDFWYDTND